MATTAVGTWIQQGSWPQQLPYFTEGYSVKYMLVAKLVQATRPADFLVEFCVTHVVTRENMRHRVISVGVGPPLQFVPHQAAQEGLDTTSKLSSASTTAPHSPSSACCPDTCTRPGSVDR